MTKEQREIWEATEIGSIIAEYDAAIAASDELCMQRIRRLPDLDRLILYAVADGASARMIGKKLGIGPSRIVRKIKKLRDYVRFVSDSYNGDLHRKR